MGAQAFLAIKAAKGRKSWGRYAAAKFARNNGVPSYLFRLACQLEAVKGV